ncbi:transposase domain-containing protein [Streptomyces sp. GMY02]|uniref:transposase domain-containing protein n=1 Tax=Streptomyces sp. GMY02 TaxID=1333528 RepID=UPI001C2B96D0|nr:transposase domain-containing protein [Streptomyces sp. GMY02]QXE33199.1 transposase domain-containing protein [Streptomyces sp. GMY02]
MRALTEKLRHLPGLCAQRLPTSSALTRARQRPGDKPLQALFERRCGTLAATATATAFAFGLRLVAWDGTALDVPDTPAKAARFEFTGKGGVNQSGHPQVCLMARVRHACPDRCGLRLRGVEPDSARRDAGTIPSLDSTPLHAKYAPAQYPPGGGMARPDHITVRDN